MQTVEVEKGKSHILTELIDYIPHSTVFKTILRKNTGTIRIGAIDKGEAFADRVYPFDLYLQIIEGTAAVLIDKNQTIMDRGTAIILPAHTAHLIEAVEPIKMILTVVKSGYEENMT